MEKIVKRQAHETSSSAGALAAFVERLAMLEAVGFVLKPGSLTVTEPIVFSARRREKRGEEVTVKCVLMRAEDVARGGGKHLAV